jgi:hypothetical protein
MRPGGVAIGITSASGESGTTSYSYSVRIGDTVVLTAPAYSDDAHLSVFYGWVIGGVDQPLGAQTCSFTMTGNVEAVAWYMTTGDLLVTSVTVESSPIVGVVVAATNLSPSTIATTGSGTVGAGVPVTLTAPTPDPTGYVFSHWVVGGTPWPSFQKSITFAPESPLTAVAMYTAASTNDCNGCDEAGTPIPDVLTLTTSGTPHDGTFILKNVQLTDPEWCGTPCCTWEVDDGVPPTDYTGWRLEGINGAWRMTYLGTDTVYEAPGSPCDPTYGGLSYIYVGGPQPGPGAGTVIVSHS